MKKILFALLLCTSYLIPGTVLAQSKTYFHDRVDTTIYATTTGTNTYTGTNTDPNFNVAAYMRGLMVSTFIVNGNTGAATYRLVTRTGTLSSVAIKKANGAALVSGDIPDSTAILLMYYGSFWRMVGIHTAGSSAWMLTGNAGTTAGTNFIGTTDAVDFVVKTNNSEKMRVASGGTVTIGTGLTHGKLSVTGTGTASATYDITVGLAGEAMPSAYLGYKADGSGVIVLENAAHSANIFSINNGFTDTDDYLNSGRNFGIGTTSPSFKLDVNETGSSGFIAMSKSDVTQAAFGYQSLGGYLGLNNVAGNLELVRFNSPSGDDYINTALKLGIGTTSPSFKLDVNSSSASDFLIMSKNDVTQAVLGYTNSGVGGTSGYFALNNTAGNTALIQFNFGGYDYFNSGNLFGINVTTPTADFQVKGLGSTSATVTFLGENSSGTDGLLLYGDNRIFAPQIHNNANGAAGTTAMFASGTYTPTITDSANTTARTAYQCQWMRVGNVVTVSGVADVDPTLTATSTIIKLTLPIASNFTAVGNCRGTAFAQAIAAQGAAMLPTTAYAVSDFALMQWISGDVTNQPMSFTFTYLVQ